MTFFAPRQHPGVPLHLRPRWVVGAALPIARPTSQSYTVFNEFSSRLDRQLQAMRGALRVLASLNATLTAASLPPIVPSSDEIKTPSPRAASTPMAEEEEVNR